MCFPVNNSRVPEPAFGKVCESKDLCAIAALLGLTLNVAGSSPRTKAARNLDLTSFIWKRRLRLAPLMLSLRKDERIARSDSGSETSSDGYRSRSDLLGATMTRASHARANPSTGVREAERSVRREPRLYV